MNFWIFNIEKDRMIGWIETHQSKISTRQKKIFIFTYTLYWLLNITTFYFYDINSNEAYITGFVISGCSFIAVIQLLYLLLVKIRSHSQIQPIQEDISRSRTFQRNNTFSSNIMASFSQSEAKSLSIQLKVASPLRFFQQTLLFSFLLVCHTIVFVLQISSRINTASIISWHHVLFYNTLSSVILNLFAIISIGNLMMCLIFNFHIFQEYVYQQQNKLSNAFWNFLLNYFELFILTTNMAFILSSIIGFVLVGDQLSLGLFVTYISIAILIFLYKQYYNLQKIFE